MVPKPRIPRILDDSHRVGFDRARGGCFTRGFDPRRGLNCACSPLNQPSRPPLQCLNPAIDDIGSQPRQHPRPFAERGQPSQCAPLRGSRHASWPLPIRECWCRWVWRARRPPRWSCQIFAGAFDVQRCRPGSEMQVRCPVRIRRAHPTRPRLADAACRRHEHAGAYQSAGLEPMHDLEIFEIEGAADRRKIQAPVRRPCPRCRSHPRETGSSSGGLRQLTPAARSRANNENASTCSASPASMARRLRQRRDAWWAGRAANHHRPSRADRRDERIRMNEFHRGGRCIQRSCSTASASPVQ